MKLKFIWMLLLSFPVSAQQGPAVECNNCAGALNKPYPVSGNWYNPDQSGSGYIIEIQNGFVSGFYFGYEESGAPTWLIFTGPLIDPNDDSDVIWRLDSSFSKASNGNALNQSYQSPQVDETGDSVVIEFISKHNARITINDGLTQNLVPIVYSVNQSKKFVESEKEFPDMEGMWSFVFKRFSPNTTTTESLYFSDVYKIRNSQEYTENGTKFIEYNIKKFYTFPPFEILTVGAILCSNPEDQDGQRNVVCELGGFPATPFGFEYINDSMIIPIGDLGAFNFSAELIKNGDVESGLTIEAKRVEDRIIEG